MSKQPTEKHPCLFRLSKDCRNKLKELSESQKISKTELIENLIKLAKL
jgi:DNA-binding Lrp family transcriptional regulator